MGSIASSAKISLVLWGVLVIGIVILGFMSITADDWFGFFLVIVGVITLAWDVRRQLKRRTQVRA